MFKSCYSCCSDSSEEEITRRNSKDGRRKTPTVIKPTNIEPTIIKPTPIAIDKQLNPAKSPVLPPDTIDASDASSKQGFALNPEIEMDCLNEYNRSRALHGLPPLTSLPLETTACTIIEPTIIKPTPIDKQPNAAKTPLLPPDTIDAPASSKEGFALNPEFEMDLLDEYNRLRALNGLPPLTSLPLETTARTITEPTIIKPTPIDEQPNPALTPLLPPDTNDVPASSKQGTALNPVFEMECLNEHNRLRALHGCPPVTSLPLETTARTIIEPTKIKPTPIDKQPNPSKTPMLPPDTTDVPTSSKTKNEIITTPGFELDCLNEHNRLRALHGCPPLILNPKMSAISKDWAIHMADTNSLKHNTKYTYGSNLYMSHGFTLHGSKPVQTWYKEIKDYNYEKPCFRKETGHFTQVIWKGSKELGVGVEIRDNTSWVAAHYNPPGNVPFMYAENVPQILRK